MGVPHSTRIRRHVHASRSRQLRARHTIPALHRDHPGQPLSRRLDSISSDCFIGTMPQRTPAGVESLHLLVYACTLTRLPQGRTRRGLAIHPARLGITRSPCTPPLVGLSDRGASDRQDSWAPPEATRLADHRRQADTRRPRFAHEARSSSAQASTSSHARRLADTSPRPLCRAAAGAPTDDVPGHPTSVWPDLRLPASPRPPWRLAEQEDAL